MRNENKNNKTYIFYLWIYKRTSTYYYIIEMRKENIE